MQLKKEKFTMNGSYQISLLKVMFGIQALMQLVQQVQSQPDPPMPPPENHFQCSQMMLFDDGSYGKFGGKDWLSITTCLCQKFTQSALSLCNATLTNTTFPE